jgi:hypothetical protein
MRSTLTALVFSCVVAGCQIPATEEIVERHDLMSVSIPKGPGEVTTLDGITFVDGGQPSRPAVFEQTTCFIYRSSNTEPLKPSSKQRRHVFNYPAFVERARANGYDGYVIVGDHISTDSRGRRTYWETMVVPFRYAK